MLIGENTHDDFQIFPPWSVLNARNPVASSFKGWCEPLLKTRVLKLAPWHPLFKKYNAIEK